MLNLSNKVLTEGGRVLLEHGGSFRSFISQAGNDARKMVELVVEKIPSYRDEATYEVRVIESKTVEYLMLGNVWIKVHVHAREILYFYYSRSSRFNDFNNFVELFGFYFVTLVTDKTE